MSSSSSNGLDIELVKRVALRYAVDNALRYGKAKVGPVMNKVLGELKELRPYARRVAEIVQDVVNYVNSLAVEDLRRLSEELGLERKRVGEERKELPPLPNVDEWKRVCTRFAPNPDFAIHLGNARAAILSYEYARMYGGKFILRFEDTDPRIKSPLPEAYRSIEEDLKWLGISWDEEYIQSLRMEIYYDVVKKLIGSGGAYVDLCPAQRFRELRNVGKACPHREDPPEIQLERFDKMLEGYYGEGEAVVRIKTDLSYPDPAVRDWVAFRVIDTSKHPHPVTGDRYIVWPTYNFAAAVDDHLMGITHILRGREHAVNTIKQMFIYKHLGWRYPEVVNFGRVNIEGFILSKSRMKELLRRFGEKFLGIDDPRFGTIAALRRRGILPETVKKLILELGVKPTDAMISWENIASLNRKIADGVCKRVFVVENPVKLIIEGLSLPREVSIRFHPSRDLGVRRYVISKPEVYVSKTDAEEALRKGGLRLMEFANVELLGSNGTDVHGKLVGGGVEEARSRGWSIVQWVPVEHAVRVVILRAEGMKLRRIVCVGEEALKNLESEVVQMVRIGFGRVDRVVRGSVYVIYAHS